MSELIVANEFIDFSIGLKNQCSLVNDNIQQSGV